MVRYVSRKGSHPKAEDSLRFAALEMSEKPEQTEAADAQKPAQRGPGGHWPRKTIGLPGGVNALEQTAPAFAGRLGAFDQGHNGGSGASLVPGRQWRLGSHAAPDAVRTNSSTGMQGIARSSGDVLIAISTSGRSPNILQAIGAAHEKGLTVVGFTGRTGGEMAARCDLCLHAPSDATPLIQQIHITAGHIICGLVEERLFPRTSQSDRTNRQSC